MEIEIAVSQPQELEHLRVNRNSEY